MIKNSLVSIIIIFFNAKKENFFEEAIESILAQTYTNWELILADDGSTDESTAIAQGYAQQYPDKIRYVEHDGHKNRGMSATRNLGIRNSQGEYVAFLDADDLWLPHKLEEQVPILEAHPEAAMLYGRTKYWFSWMENNPCIWKFNQNDEPGDFLTITSKRFDTLIEPSEQLILFLENKDIYPCTCSLLIRRWVFEEIGMFEEEFRNAHEDMVFHAKVFLRVPVYVSSQCWDLYRMHPNSYWRVADLEGKGKEVRYIGHLKYLLWLENYLSEQEIKDSRVWKALKKALWPYKHPRLNRQLRRIRHPVRTIQNLLKKVEKKLFVTSSG
jgi:glycosyltransferase involved in cell wall biosynthesis